MEIKNILGEIIFNGDDLSEADLRGADLRDADLRDADLSGADLSGANLRGADLSEADLDMSCFDLSCKTLAIKSCSRLRIQLAYHLCSLFDCADEISDEEKHIFELLKPYANKFHRTELKRF